MHIRRELIKISESVLDQASNSIEVSDSGEKIIQNAEKSLFDLAERGHFNQSILKFESALKQTIEMAITKRWPKDIEWSNSGTSGGYT